MAKRRIQHDVFLDPATGSVWVALDYDFRLEMLGYLLDILRADDKRSVKEQLEDRYSHGGGWRPIEGFTRNAKTGALRFPGDPPYRPAAFTHIHGETVVFYPMCSLLCVIQSDGSWEVTRVD